MSKRMTKARSSLDTASTSCGSSERRNKPLNLAIFTMAQSALYFFANCTDAVLLYSLLG